MSAKEPLHFSNSLSPPYDDEPLDSLSPSASPGPPSPCRGSRESSMSRGSTYSDIDPALTEKSNFKPKEYHCYYVRKHLDMMLTTPGNEYERQTFYYSEVSSYRHKKPDLTLHLGDSKDSPIVGTAKFRAFSMSSSLDVGLGDPASHDVVWEEMHRTGKLNHAEYVLAMPTRDNTRRGREYVWKRTHDVKEEEGTKWSMMNHKLIDKQTGEVMAMVVSNGLKTWKKFGKIVFKSDMPTEWEEMVILSGLALVEKARRRMHRRTAAANAGAAGG